MEYVYGALLLHSAGQEINETNLKKVIKASGAKVDNVRIKALVASLEGVDIDEAIKTAAPAMAAPAPVTAEAPTAGEAPAGEKKEEKKKPEEEKKAEEEAASGLASLFG